VKGSKKLGLLAGLIILLGGFGYLVYGGIGNNLVYFLTPTELEAKGASAIGAPVRLGGQVVPGSVTWNAAALDLRFRMTDGKNVVEVHAQKAPPQMFREGMGVVVEGKMQKNGVFDASSLMVKHSNEYRPPTKGHRPEEMYRSLVRDQK
jgi:cytochrome c-type biogenesis protein CcmE